ncbi:MAG: tRNA (adenosine(37)-N6)-threonylcarbamoyltransferase complex ATPase subunit type 1 TsaE, partial [Phycisphaerales bacterium]|nr:tRNA (adenosine(37)-N6)-threonylcarbamoyltransferase complex ATPase subunit type 1 TsaE [Phycisphaerales bacterium]
MNTESTNPDREVSPPAAQSARVFAFQSRSEDDTERIAALVAAMLSSGDCVTLTGELGAGKTAFTRGVARALGHDPRNVSSPTFVLLNEYLAPPDRAQIGRAH